MKKYFLALIVLLASVCPNPAISSERRVSESDATISWQAFDQAAFSRARSEGKLILFDLVAVWCHWCHVMDAETYSDPEVVAYINQYFVPVQVDHDARPDLAERYREWGWPATIVLSSDGNDIVKRAGYISTENMLSLLKAVVNDPSPEQDEGVSVPDIVAEKPALTKDLEAELIKRHRDSFDTEEGGLDIAMKFIDQDSVLWSLRQAKAGDKREQKRLKQTLNAAKALIDPAFGGAYQYSTHGDWKHPHYEKIMKTQWSFLISYSLACQQLENSAYCDSAEKVAAYLMTFLTSPDGGFYSSQDADLKQGSKAHDYFALNRDKRIRLGIPKIDKHRYAATNGMAIEGLSQLYIATQNKQYLDAAETAALWAVKNRQLWGGGFRHDKFDSAGPYLADTLFMGRAFLALYKATDKPEYLKRALRSSEFIDKQFRHQRAGLVAAADNGTPLTPSPQVDQNIQVALWLLDLYKISQQSETLELAKHVMRYLATSEIALDRLTEAGILEANSRLRMLNNS